MYSRIRDQRGNRLILVDSTRREGKNERLTCSGRSNSF